MRITVLTHLDKAGDSRHDVAVDQIAAALRAVGHKPSVLGVHGDVRQLLAGLARRRPNLVFNVMETFGDTELGAVGVAGLLDLLGIPYTGVGPGEMYLQEDKALTKKLLAFDGIRYPDFAVFSDDAGLETGGHLRMPLFVKPLRMDGSIGIGGESLVRDATELMKRVAAIQEQVHDAALVEEYIEGREFYVGLLGNGQPQIFPPIEMDFSGLPEGSPHVLGSRAKWDQKSAEYRGTRAVLADVSDELKARLQATAADAYRALRVRDYGRIDLRLTPAGEVFVIEVNANCYLEQSSEFAAAAAAAGLDYPTLIGRIADCALDRYSRGPKEARKKRRKPRAATQVA